MIVGMIVIIIIFFPTWEMHLYLHLNDCVILFIKQLKYQLKKKKLKRDDKAEFIYTSIHLLLE